MRINKLSWGQIICICLFTALISGMGSTGTNTCNWNQPYGNAAHTAHCDTNTNLPFNIQWEKTMQIGSISGSPVISGDYLVLLNTMGTLTYDFNLICYKITRAGLQNVWSRPLSWVDLGDSPAIAGNRVLCSSLGKFHCFDLETGDKLWEIDCEFTPQSPVIVQEAGVAAVAAAGRLSLVDISAGEFVWTTQSLEGIPCHFFDIPTVGDGKVFVCYSASDKEGIAAFNLEGELLWKRPGEIFHVFVDDFAHVTLYTGGILFAVGVPTTLFALDGESGDVLWSYEGKSLEDALSSDGTNIYVYSSADEAVSCLDVYTGEEIWKSPPLFPGDRELPMFLDKSLISSKNCVFICRRIVEDIGPSRIFALDKSTGEVMWTSDELEKLKGSLILWNDMLIAEISETLLAFGEVQGTTSTPEPTPPKQSPGILISAGVISIGILAGILIAYYLFKRKKS